MILRPNQPGAVVSPETAAFINRYMSLSTLRVRALNPEVHPRVAQELADLREIALELAFPETEGLIAETATDLNQLLTPQQAADLLGVSDRRVRQLCVTGDLAAQRIGGRWQINRQDARDYKTARAA